MRVERPRPSLCNGEWNLYVVRMSGRLIELRSRRLLTLKDITRRALHRFKNGAGR